MPHKKRDTSKKRASILDAAIQAFQEDGYDNASMDRIAEIAGASKRTVYNHFASKDTLFDAVYERFVEETTALRIVRYDASPSLEDQLSEFVDAKLLLFENPAWTGMTKVSLTMCFRDAELAHELVSKYQAGEDTLVTWLKAAKADGRLRVTNAKRSATLFWAMVSGALFWPQLLSGPLPPRQINALRKELIETFLLRHRP